MTEFQLVNHKFPNKDNIAYSSVSLSNHTRSEAMHVSAHQQPQYYQTKEDTFHGLICFSHVMYMLQTGMNQILKS